MVKIKKIKDLDYYELLDIKRGESQDEIEKAYRFKKATYQSDSLAYYKLLSEKERLFIFSRIEEAYQILSDPEKRKLYDLKILKRKDISEDKLYFRKSTQKLNIEDVKDRKRAWDKLMQRFFPRRKNRKYYEL
jgi:DnaJ-class molecular chaperone